MMKLKFAAAALASSMIVGLTPISAYAGSPACTACYGSCWDGYNGNDTMLSMCYNSCLDGDGTLCAISYPPG